ncbi:hypothetical protein ScoT_63010 [Streptomyces albidoflavus]|uniref:Uncharacterized protein n=1 Tax=Streptomyces albidoflavus TaxID=1886 RepID=A0AA37C464_9ACTN|nr:hypothetical protein ScoT_63010 [Streptomyces albidoflavus]
MESVAGQDAVHGGGGQAEDGADTGRAELTGLAQFAYPGLGARRGAVRGAVWATGPVVQARFSLFTPAADPFVGGHA